jgi:hypothetical protein
MMFVGPATAGIIIAALDIGSAYFIITGFLVVAALCQLFITTRPRDASAPKPRESMLKSATEGLRYLRRAPDVGTVLLFTLLGSALALPYTQLLPAYGEEVLKIGPAQLGVLASLAGVGSLFGSIGVTFIRPGRRGRLFIMASLLWGAALVAFCLSPGYAVAGLASILVGVAQAYNGTLGFGLLNAYTDGAYLGRVLSIMLTQNGLGTLAGFLVAVAAEAIGVRVAVLVTSVGLVAVSAGFWAYSRRLRGLA